MADLSAARDFILKEARLLERLRFAHLFSGAPTEPALAALAAFHNPDGGFGNALEPDLRAVASQPVAVQTAIEILDECGAGPGHGFVSPALDFFGSIQRRDGGIPFALPSAMDSPHAPWWGYTDESSLTQTAANCAALHQLGASHPVLDSMSEYCWQRIEVIDLGSLEAGPGAAYDLMFSIAFLNATPEEGRAREALGRLVPELLESPFMPGPGGADAELLTPLAIAPLPGCRSRELTPAELIEGDLDRLASAQLPDGGWDFPWARWSEMATAEWRGVVTLNAVKTLRVHGLA